MKGRDLSLEELAELAKVDLAKYKASKPEQTNSTLKFIEQEAQLTSDVDQCLALCQTTLAVVASKCRHTSLVKKRWLFWWVLRTEFGWTYKDIGRLTGHDHASVMHGVKSMQEKYNIAICSEERSDELA